jgi:hypothetical protein
VQTSEDETKRLESGDSLYFESTMDGRLERALNARRSFRAPRMSVEEGLVFVLVISLLIEVAVCAYSSVAVRFAMVAVIPFLVSIGLYWLPHLDQLDDAQFRGWFLIFFTFWFVPSSAACFVVAGVLTWLRRRAERKRTSV